MKAKSRKYCRNCYYPISDYSKYCSQCSQKNTDGKIPVWDFVQEFFTNLFNIDSKLFLTFFALFIPGKLTVEYFKGKHKSYASPVRLFLYSGITLFAVVISKTQDVSFGRGQEYYAKRAERVRVKQIINDNIKRFQLSYQDTANYYQSDSLAKWLRKGIGSERPSQDSISLNNVFGAKKKLRISANDFADLSVDEIAKKYELSPGFNTMVTAQQIKTMKNGKGLFHFFIGKLPVIIFAMMPFLAIILMVLYARRKNHYFVEHLVFSFHTHTFVFLVTLALVLFGQYIHGIFIALSIFGILIYFLLAMKRFYGQGFFKTFLKFSLLSFTYMFLIIVFFTLSVTISFFLF